MRTLVTADGWTFHAQSFVHIGEKLYDMDELTQAQLECVGATLNVQGLNAAYAGEAVFRAEGVQTIGKLFPCT